MSIDDPVRINGFLTSWGSTELRFDGEAFHIFTDIDYSDKRTRALVYGVNRAHAPIGRTSGKYEPGVLKLTGEKKSVQALREFFAARSPSGTSYGDAIIPMVTLQFMRDNEVINVEFVSVTWESDSSTHSESSDGMFDSVELQPMLIRRDGLTLHGGES